MPSPRRSTPIRPSSIVEALRRGLRPVDPVVLERLVQAAADDPAVGSVSGVSIRGLRVRMTIGLPATMTLEDALAHRDRARSRVQRFVGPRGRVELTLQALLPGMVEQEPGPDG